MDYEEFKWSLLDEVRQLAGAETVARLNKIQKNNGVSYDGITIFRKDENLSPVLDLDNYYKRFRDGETLSSLAESLIRTHREACSRTRVPSVLCPAYEDIEEKLSFRVVNTERNLLVLENVPHRDVLDLSFILYYGIDIGCEDQTAVLVRNEEKRRWGKTDDELLERAFHNALSENDICLTPISTILENLGSGTELFPDCGLYVLSNKNGCYGAGTIFLPDIPARLAALFQKDYLVIPSSVHEVLIYPFEERPEPDEICRIVRTINRTEVAPDEILSDNVYVYLRGRKELTLFS